MLCLAGLGMRHPGNNVISLAMSACASANANVPSAKMIAEMRVALS